MHTKIAALMAYKVLLWNLVLMNTSKHILYLNYYFYIRVQNNCINIRAVTYTHVNII